MGLYMNNFFFTVFFILFFNHSVASTFEEMKKLLAKPVCKITTDGNLANVESKLLTKDVFSGVSTCTEKSLSSTESFAYDRKLSPSRLNRKTNQTRTRFTREQITKLKEAYAQQTHPDRDAKNLIAQRLGLDHNNVKHWFANKRRLEKNEDKKCPPSSNGKKRKNFSQEQLKILTEVFNDNPNSNKEENHLLALELQASPTAIENWFKDRKKDHKKNDTGNKNLELTSKRAIEDELSPMTMSDSTDDKTFKVDTSKSLYPKSLNTLMVKSKLTKGQNVPVISVISHLISLITTTCNMDNFYINTDKYRKTSKGKKQRVTRLLKHDEYQKDVLEFLNNEHSEVDDSIRVLRGKTDIKGNIINLFNLKQFKKQIVDELELLASADISKLNSDKEIDVVIYLLNNENKKFNKLLLPLLNDYKNQLEDPDKLESLIKFECDLPNISNLREDAYKIYLDEKAKRYNKRQLMLDSIRTPSPLSELSDVSDNEAIDENGICNPLLNMAACETVE